MLPRKFLLRNAEIWAFICSRQAALEASHTLKGICGNLSFEKMFALFSEQVVLMRADKWDEAYAMMTEIAGQYDILTGTLRTWIDMQ